jgi:hypothetical protein
MSPRSERLNGIQEVGGSTHPGSATDIIDFNRFFVARGGWLDRPAGSGMLRCCTGHAAADPAHESEKRAACSSTVSVAFSCLSGG